MIMNILSIAAGWLILAAVSAVLIGRFIAAGKDS